jgi:flavin reductase (DIM6/NTAB) family NADH-FMN oxidoreductase RutF
MTTNAISSVSVEPPLLLVCVAHSAATHASLLRTHLFALNILAADQAPVAARFARSGGGEKFDGIGWAPGRFGAPVLADTCAYVEARVERHLDVYTHTVFFGRVLAAIGHGRRPLAYLAGRYGDPTQVLD